MSTASSDDALHAGSAQLIKLHVKAVRSIRNLGVLVCLS
jgi:hypothetical protein